MASEDARTMAATIIKAYVGCPSEEQFDAYQDGMSEYLDRKMFTERDALKAALRELVEAITDLQLGGGFDALARHSNALDDAESLLNPIDYGAEKRDDKAREMKQAMQEANEEAENG